MNSSISHQIITKPKPQFQKALNYSRMLIIIPFVSIFISPEELLTLITADA